MVRPGYPTRDEVASVIRSHLRMLNVDLAKVDWTVHTNAKGHYRCLVRHPPGDGQFFESRHPTHSRAGVLGWAAWLAKEIESIRNNEPHVSQPIYQEDWVDDDGVSQ